MSNFRTKSQKEWRALKEVVKKSCSHPHRITVRIPSLLLVLLPMLALTWLSLLRLGPLLLFLLFLFSLPDSLSCWGPIKIAGWAIIKICAVSTWIVYHCRSISCHPSVRSKHNPVLLICLTLLLIDLFYHALLSLCLILNNLNELLTARWALDVLQCGHHLIELLLAQMTVVLPHNHPVGLPVLFTLLSERLSTALIYVHLLLLVHWSLVI